MGPSLFSRGGLLLHRRLCDVERSDRSARLETSEAML
jgi:hypothetical protein